MQDYAGAVLIAALWACGPKDGSTGESASETAGTGHSASESDSANPTGSGSSSDSGGAVCGEFQDAMSTTPVDIVVRNEGSSAFFFPFYGACEAQPYRIMAPEGADPVAPTVGGCATCEGVIAGECECPGAPCQQTNFLMLAPGGEYKGTWSGLLFAPTDLPAECASDCGDRCDRRVQAPAGTYTFETVFAGTVAEGCTDEMGEPAACTCTPNADGWCLIFGTGGDIVDDPLATGAELVYPDGTLVELVLS